MRTNSFWRRVRDAWRVLTGTKKRGEGWDGGRLDRLTSDWNARLIGSDEEVRRNAPRMRARARELAANNGYAQHYLTLLVANVVGHCGFKLQAQVRTATGTLNSTTNKAIEAAWREWSEAKVTVDARLNLLDLQDLLLATVATDGEAFVRKVGGFDGNAHGFALQVIDADLLDATMNVAATATQPEVRMGIEVNAVGAPLGYWFWDRPEESIGYAPRTRYRVAASEILHLFRPRRPNQTRGVTWLQSAMYPLHVLDGYEEAELFAARTAASKMGFFQSREGAISDGEAATSTPIEIEASPAGMEKLPVGWEFTPWNPDHPVTAFAAFIKTVLRKIAGGLGVSYNSIASDLEGVNYSSLKNGLGGERDAWRILQRWWVGAFLQEVYREWMSWAMLSGALRLDSRDHRRYGAARWAARGWPWIEPLKEMQAAVLAIGNGLGSRTAFLADQGIELEDVFDELAAEQAAAEKAGIEIDAGLSGNPVEEQPTGADPAVDDPANAEPSRSSRGVRWLRR